MTETPHQCIRQSGLNCLVNTDRFTPDEACQLLADGASRLFADATEIFRSRNAVSYRVTCGDTTYFAKEITHLRTYRQWVDRFACPTSFRTFWAGLKLIDADLPTPTPIIATQLRTDSGPRQFLVTDYCHQAVGLDVMVRQSRSADRFAILTDLANLLADFHRRGFYSRHLRSANILVQPGPPRTFWFIDLDRMMGHRWLFYDVYASTVSRAAFEFYEDLTQAERHHLLAACFDAALKHNIYHRPSLQKSFKESVIKMVKARRHTE
jgi:hypothetical protein